jgi:hypothetical protein
MAGVPIAIMVLLGLLTLGPHLARTRRSGPDQKSNRPPVLWTVNPEELRGGSTNHKVRGAVRKGVAVIDDQPHGFDSINRCRSLRCER